MDRYLKNRQANEETYLQEVEDQVEEKYRQVEEQMQNYKQITQ